MENDFNRTIQKAISGDRQALGNVLTNVQDLVYNLSLRMLLYPSEAEDATQEILIKVMTHLSTFKGKSQFKTWVYRIASNYLLTLKSKQNERMTMSFDEYAQFIDTGQSDTVAYAKNKGELFLLEEEVKISCTHGLLLCLKPMARVVYILGVLLELNSKQGAVVLEISPANFRQQLSRSKRKINNFLEQKCGLANTEKPCRCHKKIDFLANQDLISIDHLKFAKSSTRSLDLLSQISDLEQTVAIYQSTPNFELPLKIKQQIHELLNLT